MTLIFKKKSKMNKIAFEFLVFAICFLAFEAVNGKITTTRSSNICGKGSTITFPTYVSNIKDVSSTDPSYFKKCKRISSKFGLWILCFSGPKYECSKPSTTTSSTTMTTGTTTRVPVTTQTGLLCECNMTSTAITATTTSTTSAPTKASTMTASTTTASTTINSITTDSTTTASTTINSTTTASTTINSTTTDATRTASTTTDATTIDATTIDATTIDATTTVPPGCSNNGTYYPVGNSTIIAASCGSMSCQRDGTWTSVITRGNCSSPFSNSNYGCILKVTSTHSTFCSMRNTCQANGGDLWTSAYLDSLDNFSQISAAFGLNRTTTYIGIYGNGPNLYWLNGTVANDKYNSMKLSTSRNISLDNTDFAVVSAFGGGINFGWDMAEKNQYYLFLCERLP